MWVETHDKRSMKRTYRSDNEKQTNSRNNEYNPMLSTTDTVWNYNFKKLIKKIFIIYAQICRSNEDEFTVDIFFSF